MLMLSIKNQNRVIINLIHCLILILSIHFGCGQASSQTKTITLNCYQQPLKIVLKEIQAQAGINLVYDANLIGGKNVTCHLKKMPLEDVLNTILNKFDIDYIISSSRTVVLFKSLPAHLTLYGRIIDSSSEEGLAYANILINRKNEGTASDQNGFFQISNVPADLCTVMVHYIGYHPGEIIARDLTDSTFLRIKMRQKPVEMQPITVTAEKIPRLAIATQAHEIEINPGETSFLPGASHADILQTLQRMPGSNAVSEHFDGLYLQGGTPDQNQVLFDGIPIFHSEHLWGYMNVLNQPAISQVRLKKAGFPARYGDKLSSVIELEGQSGDSDKWQIGLGADFVSAYGFVQLPITKNMKCFITARHSFSQLNRRGIYDDFEDFLFLVKRKYQTDLLHGEIYNFYDLTGKCCYQASARNEFAVTFFRTQDKIDITKPSSKSGTRLGDRIETWHNLGIGLNWKHSWNRAFRSHATVVLANYVNEYFYRYSLSEKMKQTFPDSSGILHLNDDIHINERYIDEIGQIILKINNELTISPYWDIEFGGEISHITIGHQFPSESWWNRISLPSIPEFQIDIPASTSTWEKTIYFQNIIKYRQSPQISIGLRTASFEPLKRIQFELRLTLERKWGEHFKLDLAWGQYYQYLHRITIGPGDFVPMRTSFYWALSDESLKPEFAEHKTAGFQYTASHYGFEVSAYRKDYKNLLHLLPYDYRERDKQKYRYLDQGEANSKGLEIFLQKKTGFLTGWLSYHLSKTDYQFQRVNQGVTYVADHDRTHTIKLVGCLRRRGWTFSVVYAYATGSPYTPGEYVHYNSSIQYDFDLFFEESHKNQKRLGEYQRLDVGLRKEIKRIFVFDLDFGISILNVFNRRNILNRYYQNKAENPSYKIDMPGLAFTPMVFVNISFP